MERSTLERPRVAAGDAFASSFPPAYSVAPPTKGIIVMERGGAAGVRLPAAIPMDAFPTQPPVDIVAKMLEKGVVVPCDPQAPPELPRGAYSLNSFTTLVFQKVVNPVGLLATVNAAVCQSKGADTDTEIDTEIDNERCRLRVCAWTSAPGTGAADSAEFSVRLYTDSTGAGTPKGVVHLAEFQRRHGDAFCFWRVLRRALDALVAAKLTVAPMSPWGADPIPLGEPPCGVPSMPETAMHLSEEDVRPVVRMVHAEYEKPRAEGCKIAVSVAAAVRYSEIGMQSCIDTGLVAGVVEVMCSRWGVESRTAATTAFAEWVSTDLGQRKITSNSAACKLADARRALIACVDVNEVTDPTDYTAKHLKRESTRALLRVGRV